MVCRESHSTVRTSDALYVLYGKTIMTSQICLDEEKVTSALYGMQSTSHYAVPYMILGLSVSNAVYGIRFRGTGRCEPTRQECSVLFFPVLFYSTVSTTDVILYNYMPHFSYVIIMIVRSAASVQSSTVKSFFSFLCC